MKKLHIDHNSEFELDLAPLLAVMVKLVPVLLVSSAFIQVMIVETELPQVVTQAIEKQRQDPKKTISLEVSLVGGIKIVIDAAGKSSENLVPLKKDGGFDFPALHNALLEVKKANPEIFQIDLIPENSVPYKDIVKIMDETRKARDLTVKFPVFDEKKGQTVETNYMFPEIVFVNITEG
ncbi:MAG: biopolymer transporter ExbD [Bdellovibrionaceae bacterium]|nr:biopolymer transporter ExbD [Pseudobdellovibrionaceae bacterium]